jgi:hypothetical protein
LRRSTIASSEARTTSEFWLWSMRFCQFCGNKVARAK